MRNQLANSAGFQYRTRGCGCVAAEQDGGEAGLPARGSFRWPTAASLALAIIDDSRTPMGRKFASAHVGRLRGPSQRVRG
jgi:hypothetical protein